MGLGAARGVTGSGITFNRRLDGVIGGPVNSLFVGTVGENFNHVCQFAINIAMHVGTSMEDRYKSWVSSGIRQCQKWYLSCVGSQVLRGEVSCFPLVELV